MRFSIIIPVYNAECCLEKTLESVAQQTFKDYELILVLDSCTDDSEAIARRYTDKVIKVEEHHSGYTRNHGLDMAQGEYVLFMDDDDWYLHEYVLWQIDQKITQENNPDIIFFSFIFKGMKYHNPQGRQYLPAFWNKVWRREFIQDIRCKGTDTYESDVEFQDMALARNPRIVEWDMPLYYYNYMRKGSMSDKRGR